jgi:hypothetical protein
MMARSPAVRPNSVTPRQRRRFKVAHRNFANRGWFNGRRYLWFLVQDPCTVPDQVCYSRPVLAGAGPAVRACRRFLSRPLPARPNGHKNAKLCCRSRPDLVERAKSLIVSEEIFRDGECDEHDQLASGSSLPPQYPLERGKSATCRVVAFCPLALRVGGPRR